MAKRKTSSAIQMRYERKGKERLISGTMLSLMSMRKEQELGTVKLMMKMKVMV